MKTRSVCGCATLGALLLTATPVAAQPLSWDYTAFSLLAAGKVENGGSERLDKGFRLDVAQPFQDNFFFRGKTELQSFDDVGLDTTQIGAGAFLDLEGIQFPVQIYAGLNYERLNLVGVSDGFGIDLGARAEFVPNFEGGIAYKTANLSGAQSIDYRALELSVVYTGADGFDVIGTLNNADFDNDDDFNLENIVGIGVRIPF
jgi:hypothetical protein